MRFAWDLRRALRRCRLATTAHNLHAHNRAAEPFAKRNMQAAYVGSSVVFAHSDIAKQRLAEVFGAVPDYVRYAPIDFDKQKLEDVLPPLGYDPKQKTFFILEGVTMYVVAEGVGATLDFVRRNSAPGSRLVYDYLLRPVIERKYKGYWAADFISFAVERAGEPYVTGWTPPEAAAFARKHGLVVVEDVGEKELLKRHMTGSDGKPDGRLLNWQRMIEARVP